MHPAVAHGDAEHEAVDERGADERRATHERLVAAVALAPLLEREAVQRLRPRTLGYVLAVLAFGLLEQQVEAAELVGNDHRVAVLDPDPLAVLRLRDAGLGVRVVQERFVGLALRRDAADAELALRIKRLLVRLDRSLVPLARVHRSEENGEQADAGHHGRGHRPDADHRRRPVDQRLGFGEVQRLGSEVGAREHVELVGLQGLRDLGA